MGRKRKLTSSRNGATSGGIARTRDGHIPREWVEKENGNEGVGCLGEKVDFVYNSLALDPGT